MRKIIFGIIFLCAFILVNAQTLQVTGDISVGENTTIQTGYGNKLHLRGLDDSGYDPMWLSRFNMGVNTTALRINIGDDNSGDDRIVIGSTPGGNWIPLFTILNNGRFAFGADDPGSKYHFQLLNNESLLIGKYGDAGNLSVPLGALSAQYNLDFSGYRDVNLNQVGARISALRFNNHQPNSALIQKTGLAFYTNPTGQNSGDVDLIERMRITPEGNIGIGTFTNLRGKLDVNGTIYAKEVLVTDANWADFVFDANYQLPSLESVEQHIKEKGHLPEIPSAAEVKENGVNVVDVQAKLLQKIEEMTLYMIQQQKEIEALKTKVKSLEK